MTAIGNHERWINFWTQNFNLALTANLELAMAGWQHRRHAPSVTSEETLPFSGIMQGLGLCTWPRIRAANAASPTSPTSPCLPLARTSRGTPSNKGASTSSSCPPNIHGRISRSKYV
jgi:hypothetical protein